MAPQQNSTLIDEKLGDYPSLSNIPEINCYSPILAAYNKENHDKNNNDNNKFNTNNPNNGCQYYDINCFSKWDLVRREKRDFKEGKHCRHGDNRSSHSRRSRSISLYGANSTVKQGHEEITIWLEDEPRYVSGVTNKTTCKDIIKALIDDEINNGNFKYCQRLKDGSVSRDYSDYVITECWRGIERSYDGNMAILPVWKAWSRVHNEIRLSLKHLRDIQDPAKALKTNITLSSIRNYIYKLLRFGKSKNRNTKSKKSTKIVKSKARENKAQPCHVALILDAEPKSSQKEKNLEYNILKYNMKSLHENKNIDSKTNICNQKLYKLVETRSSVRKRRSSSRRKIKKSCRNGKISSSHIGDGSNFLRKRKDSSLRSSIRDKLAKKNAEMNELYDREYALTRELTNKCKMYKLHNELYTTCERNLEISVGQIQQSIEACAKEIIKTEHDLLEVKNEIKNDISIINSLKRLTLDSDSNENVVPNYTKNSLKPQPAIRSTATPTTEHMLFVDNIYEFCDNNASMLV